MLVGFESGFPAASQYLCPAMCGPTGCPPQIVGDLKTVFNYQLQKLPNRGGSALGLQHRGGMGTLEAACRFLPPLHPSSGRAAGGEYRRPPNRTAPLSPAAGAGGTGGGACLPLWPGPGSGRTGSCWEHWWREQLRAGAAGGKRRGDAAAWRGGSGPEGAPSGPAGASAGRAAAELGISGCNEPRIARCRCTKPAVVTPFGPPSLAADTPEAAVAGSNGARQPFVQAVVMVGGVGRRAAAAPHGACSVTAMDRMRGGGLPAGRALTAAGESGVGGLLTGEQGNAVSGEAPLVAGRLVPSWPGDPGVAPRGTQG